MVKLVIDLERRKDLERLHTATHILNYSLRKVLGNHIWQNGSNLKQTLGTLDVTHYQNLSFDEIVKVENLANRIILEGQNVIVEELNRDEAEKKYGFTLYQGGAVPMLKLRIVKVADYDVEACGGLHVRNTKDVGLIKIIDTQKIQDGVVRVKFVVNRYALEYIHEIESIIYNIQKDFNIEKSTILKTIYKFFENWKKEVKTNNRLKEILLNHLIKYVVETNVSEIDLHSFADMKFLIDVFNSIVKEIKDFTIKCDKFIITTNSNLNVKFQKIIDKNEYKIYIL